MATLNYEKRIKRRKRKIKLTLIMFVISLAITPYLAVYIDRFLSNGFSIDNIKVEYLKSFISVINNKNQFYLFLVLEGFMILFILYMFFPNLSKIKSSKTMKITDSIEIPVAVGNGQHGTSRFLNEKEIDQVFHTVKYKYNKQLEVKENLGLVLGMRKEYKAEHIYCLKDDVNSIILGSTRSGKTRRVILETIWLRSQSNKSFVVTDVKGELFIYTSEYLKSKGYEVIDFDLRQPEKSKKYNYLDKIIKAVEENKIPNAIDYTWDLVSVMVGVPKGEPLWTNGQAAVIASAILAVTLEAPKKYKNLTNVYYFLANMCKTDINGEMYITKYFRTLPDHHPAKSVFDVAEISPEKMRGSFFGMALTTLRLYTNWNIADVTSESEFNIEDIGKKKTALFIIIPDEKTTLYPLVSLFVNQIYVSLIEVANKSGGRLPYEVDFICDEFGNFPEIPSFGTMLSAGLGRGIRFSIVLQDFQQLEKKYKEDYGNIKANCLLLIYLRTTDLKTQEEISKKTGTYTIEVNSASSSSSLNSLNRESISSSANMQSRALLMPEEIGRISSPYTLVLYSGHHPAILYTPDLSQYKANELYGLGDENHNKKVYFERDNKRPVRSVGSIGLWSIWKMYQPINDLEELKDIEYNEEFEENVNKTNSQNKRVSFLK